MMVNATRISVQCRRGGSVAKFEIYGKRKVGHTEDCDKVNGGRCQFFWLIGELSTFSLYLAKSGRGYLCTRLFPAVSSFSLPSAPENSSAHTANQPTFGKNDVWSRAWAVLHNYWDGGQKTRKENGGHRCPAERLNGKRYAVCWLENLLVATSAVPKTKPPPNPA